MIATSLQSLLWRYSTCLERRYMYLQFLGRSTCNIFFESSRRRQLEAIIHVTSDSWFLLDRSRSCTYVSVVRSLIQYLKKFLLLSILVVIFGWEVFLDHARGREDYLMRVHLRDYYRRQFYVLVRGVKFVIIMMRLPILRRLLLLGFTFQVIQIQGTYLLLMF
jgi:hypothetical protein